MRFMVASCGRTSWSDSRCRCWRVTTSYFVRLLRAAYSISIERGVLVICGAMTITRALGVVLFTLFLSPFVCAQSNEKVQQTYIGPDVSPLWELLKDPGAKDTRVDVLKFTPVRDSGVAQALGEAIGATPEERAALVQAFEGSNRL